MALTNLQKIRYELGDVDPGFPIMSDSEYEYFLEKNNDQVRRASLDAAKTILFKLSMTASDSTVDIFSLKGSKAAESYRQALVMYIKNPDLNEVLQNVKAYFGGVSKTDMEANDANIDNNTVPTVNQSSYPTDYFSV